MSRRFDALCKDVSRVLASMGQRTDANETIAFARQLEFVQQEVVEVEFPELQADKWIPQLSGVNPGADNFRWYDGNTAGRAKMIANYADDLPNVTKYLSENLSPIRSEGVSYSYSIQDIRRAVLLGIPLESDLAIRAREAIERLRDQVLGIGDTTRGISGFVNSSLVPILSVGLTGTWASATADQILSDLNTMAAAVWSQSGQVHKADTILLPTAPYTVAASKPYNTTGDGSSVLAVFLRNNPWGIKQVDSWAILDTAGADSGPRAVVYQKDPRNLHSITPILFESLPPQARDLEFVVPCHGRVGGTVWQRPLAGVYVDVLA